MNPKLIFFDIDGTLSMPGCGVSDRVKESLVKAKENGHYLFINTGRTDKDIPDYIKELTFDGGVYSAGGKVIFHDKVLSQTTLSPEEITKIRELFDSLDINYTLEGVNNNYCLNPDEFNKKPEDFEKLSTELQRFLADNSGLSTPLSIEKYTGEPVYKVNFRVNEKEKEKIERVNKELGEDFRVDYFINMFSGLGTIAGEVTNYDINKGNGIKILSEYLNIPMEDTIAFGDSSNDLDMIKAAQLGVAMGNASDNVKEAANLICETCHDDGIAKTLKRLEIA